MSVENVDLGKGLFERGCADVEVVVAERSGSRVPEDRLNVLESAEEALLLSLESLEGVGVGLDGVSGRGNLVIEHNQNTAVLGTPASSKLDGGEQVDGAVGTDSCGGPHRADDNNRLLALDGKIEEEGRLLQGVGTVGDDDALCVGAVEVLLDLLGKVGQDDRVDIPRVNVGELNTPHVGDVAELGYGLDKSTNTESTGLVTSSLISRASRASNCTTSSENGDVGKTGVEALEFTSRSLEETRGVGDRGACCQDGQGTNGEGERGEHDG